jgi:diguanylate cyclase (GGDEF)-like protein/PAS domain S-box-containing protein
VVFLVVAGTGVAATWALRLTAETAYRTEVVKTLRNIAEAAAALIEVDDLAALRSPEQHGSPEFEAIAAPMRKILYAVDDVKYLYTVQLRGDQIVFLVDSALPGDNDHDGVEDQSQLFEVYEDAPPEAFAAAEGGEVTWTREPYTDDWGTFVTLWRPLKDSAGETAAVVGVDMEADHFVAEMAQIRRTAWLGWGISLGSGACIAPWYYFTRRRNVRMDAALRESEARFREIANAVPVMMWLTDTERQFCYFNRPWVEFTGQPPREVRPATLGDLVHPDDLARVLATREAAMNAQDRFEVEYRVRGRDGVYRWIADQGTPRYGTSGRFEGYAGGARDISARKAADLRREELEGELRLAATTDRLTGLPNRAMLASRIQSALARRGAGGEPAVLFLDFDRFKLINDSLGHDIGDRLLVSIAERLRNECDPTSSRWGAGVLAMPARIGGDEFVIVLEHADSPGALVRIAGRLLEVFASPHEIDSYRLVSTASIGAVTIGPDYTQADEVLRDADTAMYEAKNAGRGRVVVFDTAMRDRVRRRATLENSMHDGVRAGEFFLLYQPIVASESGRTTSVEALLRWNHPHLGLVSPVEFIPIAEECGLIVPLTEWVIHNAADALSGWARRVGPGHRPSMCINLSQQHFVLPGLAEQLSALVRGTGLDTAQVHLEITESTVMRNIAAGIAILHELREAGFRLALDDFGTGYSSLASLHRFPFDILKIDRGFISNLALGREHLALVNAIADLAHNLRMDVVAEGIETLEQLAAVQALDCQFAQGFLFGKPMPAAGLESLLVRQSRLAA